jgi:kumamolisin
MKRLALSTLLLLTVSSSLAGRTDSNAAPSDSMVRLPGHVLSVLPTAKTVPSEPRTPDDQFLTLTLVLSRDDQAGFERYLRDAYDPRSPNYRRFLTQLELSERFGPSQKAYDAVLSYLQKSGLTLVEKSTNRLTLTVRGARAKAEEAFAVEIRDYEIDGRRFFANAADPAFPGELASHVASVSGLSNLATPRPAHQILYFFSHGFCLIGGLFDVDVWSNKDEQKIWEAYWRAYKKCVNSFAVAAGHNKFYPAVDPPPPAWQGVDGNGQKIGLVAFDTFHMTDVQDYITYMGLPADQINRVNRVAVNGGAGSTPGPNQDEVLLDIAAVLGISPAAQVVVYEAPFTGRGSFQAVFNAMLNDGVSIISNSWAYCEDQTTLADVQSIDAIFQAAAASGVSVFNASGDTGSSCLNGSSNTAAVPASSPSATAVGGTSLKLNPGFTYKSETWWNGTSDTPPTGQGGFGTSRFFSRPGYQDGLSAATMRSVPDVVVNADPAGGLAICAKDMGGCPTGALYGGTSVAAPIWAAFTALLNQSQGSNLGTLNPLLYPLAGTDAFYGASSMGSDFAHVGLGSPNLARLHQRLTGQTPGAVSPSVSQVRSIGPGNAMLPPDAGVPPRVPADGATEAHVVVRLGDGNGNPVGGKNVTLTPDPPGSANIDPPVGVSGVLDGVVTFTITNVTPENLTFTATDTTDGIVLSETASIEFIVPRAASGGISAAPTPVIANGVDTTTITVTLRDSLSRPTPGKLVRLTQGTGRSVITGPDPSVTDVSGQIQFTATNLFNEAVTYSAIDVTDGDLPIPGTSVVTFTSSSNLCGSGAPIPTGQSGYMVTPFATGFVARPLSFGGINFAGCPGASTPAFLDDKVFFSDWTGDVIRLGVEGGALSSADRLANVGPTLGWPAVGKDGRVYMARVATTGNFNTGAILEIDPSTGNVLRNVVSNVRCPFSLAVDPLSGDLFFDDGCSGAGSDDPRIYRIRNPGSASPTLEVYATLPATPNGKMSFAPDGTLYVVTGYFSPTPTISRVSGTNVPGPPGVSTVPGVNSFFWVNVAESDSNGAARSLLTLSSQGLELVDITLNPPARTLLASNLGGGEIGPDGCLYSPIENVVYRLTNPAGTCGFVPAGTNPSLSLAPRVISPNPAQGSSQLFTATFQNITVPADTPVFFQITGSNPRLQMVRTDANGQASYGYAAVSPGTDIVVATATVGDTSLTSNGTRVTWAPGKHVTFTSLNLSPRSGSPGVPLNVVASLSDSSVTPPAPLAGQTIHFQLGGSQCAGTTNAQGIAACGVVPGPAGPEALTATFPGTGTLAESQDSVSVDVIELPSAETTPPVITISALPTTLWPPNGKLVRVVVSGTIADADSGVNAGVAAYSVTDEYGSVQPAGPVTLGANGAYSFTILLQASRRGNDRDGRRYVVTVTARDNAGNNASSWTSVTVPHDQGH